MKLLLDTHTYLWLRSSPTKLPFAAADAIVNPKNELYVSVVSMWEIVIKVAKGTLQVNQGGMRI